MHHSPSIECDHSTCNKNIIDCQLPRWSITLSGFKFSVKCLTPNERYSAARCFSPHSTRKPVASVDYIYNTYKSFCFVPVHVPLIARRSKRSNKKKRTVDIVWEKRGKKRNDRLDCPPVAFWRETLHSVCIGTPSTMTYLNAASFVRRGRVTQPPPARAWVQTLSPCQTAFGATDVPFAHARTMGGGRAMPTLTNRTHQSNFISINICTELSLYVRLSKLSNLIINFTIFQKESL